MSQLQVINLNKSFNDMEVLRDINFTVQKGEVIGLIGLNGVGKSTLCKCISGKINLTKGQILFDDKEDFDQLKELIYVPDSIFLPSKMSIKNIVQLFKEKNSQYNDIYINEYLNLLKIDENITFGKLSKGNQEIIQLAILISNEPKFLILDEPLAAIDVVKRELLYDKIIDLQTNGVSLIITTHIMNEIQNIFTRILLLENKTISEDKQLEDIYNDGYNSLNEYVVKKLKN